LIEGKRQEAGGRRQEAEGRRQEAEGRRQKAEGRRQKERQSFCPLPSALCPLPSAFSALCPLPSLPSAFPKKLFHSILFVLSFEKPNAKFTLDAQSPAPRNRTLRLTEEERSHYRQRLLTLHHPVSPSQLLNRTLCQDLLDVLPWLPDAFVDLLIIDPPYNLSKRFRHHTTRRQPLADYRTWLEGWFIPLLRVLKTTASIYICGDWQSSLAIYEVASQHLIVRNRITWEREKGRAARTNWKNNAEDIWFCTASGDYYFNADAVRLQRRVLAPYTDPNGKPKDWQRTSHGNFRLTAASNLWTDITVPFWSMPENTDHPTQKPEKLIAKLILASTPPGAVVFDPFLGSGTTSVVAKKLDRQFVGVEIDEHYACLAEKRLHRAEGDRTIQGYRDRIFWERNSQPPIRPNAPDSIA